jgi:ABC-2 type transport system ATP-binding protein
MIEVSNLTKQYGTFAAVKDVSFSVGKDQVLGFLGPNGAGKTTIMKVLTGFHFPSSGKVLIDGFSVEENPNETKQRIGYLPENVPLYGELTPIEYLTFMAESRLIPKKKRRIYIDRVVEQCGLEDAAYKRAETLSKGYRQRLGLAQAILHDPQILILDEPTTGLDPNQIIEIRKLITELGKSKTVILSTHILQEVEAVCSEVLILNEGIIAAKGTPSEIAHSMKQNDSWELILKAANKEDIIEKFQNLGKSAELISLEAKENETYRVVINTLDTVNHLIDGEKIFDWAVTNSFKILSMTDNSMSIEDIFVQLTRREGKNDSASA